MRKRVGMLLAMGMFGASRLAYAQASADVLFEQGRAALARGDLDAACKKFAESDKLDPAAGTRANLAQCEERRGRDASAWRVYRTALDLLPANDPRAPAIRARITAIEPRLSWLTLELDAAAPKETAVREGGAKVGPYGTAIAVDPGVHEFVFEVAGRAPRTIRSTLGKGERTTIIVRFPEAGEEVAEPAVAPPSEGALPAAVPMSKRARDTITVRVLGDDPAVTLLGPDGAPLCRVPCERFVPLRLGRLFSIGGDGIVTSDPFKLDASATLRVKAGSSTRRGGGIAMLVAGGVATLAGGVLIGVGASVEKTDQFGRSLGSVVYAPAIGGGIAALAAGAGLIAGGAVLVRQGRTEVTTGSGPRFVW